MIKKNLLDINLKYLAFCFLFILISCNKNKINYHPTVKKPVMDIYFGQELKIIIDGLKMTFHQKLKNG